MDIKSLLNFGKSPGAEGEGRKNPLKGEINVPPFLKNPTLYFAVGLAIVLWMAVSLFTGASGERELGKAQEQAIRIRSQVSEPIEAVRRLLQDEQVHELAALALEDPTAKRDLEQYLSGRLRELQEVRLFPPEAYLDDPSDLDGGSWVLMDMMMAARKDGLAPVQIGPEGNLLSATRLGEAQSVAGFLVISVNSGYLLSAFDSTLPAGGYVALEQYHGRFAPTTIKEYGDASHASHGLSRLPIANSLLRLVIPNPAPAGAMTGLERLSFFILGCGLLAFGFILRQRNLHPLVELKEDPASLRAAGSDGDTAAESITENSDPDQGPADQEPEPPGPPVALGDLPFAVSARKRGGGGTSAPVELTRDIFRAYDIRGIVGQTLDAGIAWQVGQAIGTQALEMEAGPVVVGRDGRHSGPELVKGMIEGISSTGCDVIDIGAVPTGVLYYAAYECGSGSGVMVTGSHNPPDYNGFKVMLGGKTLAQDQITGLYDRLEAGEVRIGKGQVESREMLEDYRDRIAGDIQLARPLKVVADCGNGIGGVCAADVLRAIGAEVLPLFDEVDGDFPNHHPDPSDPHNLEDLIESVKLMQADIGVAFDGDADRLGVVTPEGEIIYSDRLMMLYAREVLSRNPGETIIYDVKCTGRLDTIIREAGGEPEMYKTGHSLIKNRMKEVGAPFAGEMSGHFFFKDRWYGFDCGIYSAARLLEILAADERTPEQVLGSLPTSISTPELKVEMSEGENHAFIEAFQEKARFADARVTTIDGLRADFEYGWGLVRASNTTPILVVRFEADSEESLQIIQEAFRMQMKALNPDLRLPF
ncbi:MAG: phosphomannomutase/phosphoglucomutase [Xanthomonadales bacterium]|nr:phosphomannomutase/phosphoglucomutase [Xanthomonadales bacterium]